MIFAGIPLVLFICLGFSIAMFVKLYRWRKLLHREVIVSRYEYFYQGYIATFAYWEVLIQARKGLLAVISVLSGAIPDELKGYLALSILMVKSALHTRCNP